MTQYDDKWLEALPDPVRKRIETLKAEITRTEALAAERRAASPEAVEKAARGVFAKHIAEVQKIHPEMSRAAAAEVVLDRDPEWCELAAKGVDFLSPVAPPARVRKGGNVDPVSASISAMIEPRAQAIAKATGCTMFEARELALDEAGDDPKIVALAEAGRLTRRRNR